MKEYVTCPHCRQEIGLEAHIEWEITHTEIDKKQ